MACGSSINADLGQLDVLQRLGNGCTLSPSVVAPTQGQHSSLVSVPGSGHLFLFGGYSGWAEPRTMFGDLWSFHVASAKRAMLDCERFGAGEQHRACPSPRSGHGAVASAPRSPGTVGDMWVFGGWNGLARMHNDLHRLTVHARPRRKRPAAGPVSEQWPAPDTRLGRRGRLEPSRRAPAGPRLGGPALALLLSSAPAR